jgi:guanylate kinase
MNAATSDPLIFVISGPTGVGKTTLCHNLVTRHSSTFARAITTTTREPRPGERDGHDYYFVDWERFQELIGNGAFCEHSLVHERYLYGITFEELERHLAAGRNVLVTMNVGGAMKLQHLAREVPGHPLRGRVVTVFLLPPDPEELCRRVLRRGPMGRDEFQWRMAAVPEELRGAAAYDHVLPPDSEEKTLAALLEIGRLGKSPHF